MSIATPKQVDAVRDSLVLWDKIVSSGGRISKGVAAESIGIDFFARLKSTRRDCLLCEAFYCNLSLPALERHLPCPLITCVSTRDNPSLYDMFARNDILEIRKKAAQGIAQLLRKWLYYNDLCD